MFEIINKRMVDIIHECMREMIQPGDSVCDCTMGNGYDTLAMAELIGANGHVYSFDIQNDALVNTRELLIEHEVLGEVSLILDSHANLDHYIHEQITFFVFNLGYLPNGDTAITTQAEETVKAIRKALEITATGGGGAILSYYGHPSGKIEKQSVEELLSRLSPKQYNVVKIENFNRKNTPPVLFLVKKIK